MGAIQTAQIEVDGHHFIVRFAAQEAREAANHVPLLAAKGWFSWADAQLLRAQIARVSRLRAPS